MIEPPQLVPEKDSSARAVAAVCPACTHRGKDGQTACTAALLDALRMSHDAGTESSFSVLTTVAAG